MKIFLLSFSEGACCLLALLLCFHPLRQNPAANRWLALFMLAMNLAFTGVYLEVTGLAATYPYVLKWIYSTEFLLGPLLYISTLFFVHPAKTFGRRDALHCLPFVVYAVAELLIFHRSSTIILHQLFEVGDTVVILRDLLPLLLLGYIIASGRALIKHQQQVQLIAADTEKIDLRWLQHFLLILAVICFFWINDALFGWPVVLAVIPFVYAVAVFFLAYFAVRQGAVFAFQPAVMEEIAVMVEAPADAAPVRPPRLSDDALAELSRRLTQLMETDKIFLDNELTLPVVAEKLGVTIHDTSYLINQATGSNFYHFVNRYRVEEAQRLLLSAQAETWNMLGIAFAAGFNSKTTFNTAFKKWTGLSPTDYLKQQQKGKV
ncbi:helix-turn-helix domain-containing protein [Chitinophaga nivalis]|uniref:Helix-turn-helix domain-containing protein n=1 Tax=Chitinophaga nivalis TaxID=2991709 RepID=A0ABT3INH3_9BACT|nr:helix-turn-helix domain-containing protein [Chitinophaga nivalis]MCW3464817.1 helix-turn-helix domain-containing protein [Chitinophaga nivalis]MCW3485492.1 helix-turn-helix domain-containing protein [Chitinophaga nivalis]